MAPKVPKKQYVKLDYAFIHSEARKSLSLAARDLYVQIRAQSTVEKFFLHPVEAVLNLFTNNNDRCNRNQNDQDQHDRIFDDSGPLFVLQKTDNF